MEYQLEETILYLDDVALGYDDNVVLKNITLEEKNVTRPSFSATGQNIAIVGRSGRGKSTLFKGLTGLIKPMAGRILINELDEGSKDKAKIVSTGDIGFVDQKYTLFRHKTIQDILMFALRKKNITKEEKEATINKYLTEWGLLKQRNQYPCELSGGQRQRTAIIEQILSSGHFMIFDEPFSGLDVGNIESVKRAFELIHQAHELNTIIYSSHDIELAVELADSIYVIGHKEETDTFSTVVKHFDLKAMGLAWQPFGVGHMNLVKEVKEVMLRS